MAQDKLPTRSFWWHWKRGFLCLGKLYVLVIGLLLSCQVMQVTDVLMIPAFNVVNLVVVLALLLLLPTYVSELIPGPEEGAAQQDLRLRPLADGLASHVGLNWGGTGWSRSTAWCRRASRGRPPGNIESGRV